MVDRSRVIFCYVVVTVQSKKGAFVQDGVRANRLRHPYLLRISMYTSHQNSLNLEIFNCMMAVTILALFGSLPGRSFVMFTFTTLFTLCGISRQTTEGLTFDSAINPCAFVLHPLSNFFTRLPTIHSNSHGPQQDICATNPYHR
jgi:hypothetical protein